MGNHAYTHCKVRLDKVIDGSDKGGITKAVDWQGGGGYRFYELAPSLINEDPFGEYVINPDYDAAMLAAGVALHEGFTYQPDGNLFWKQSVGNEKSYLFVTTRHLNSAFLDSIKDTMEDDEYLIIACRSFDGGLDKAYVNITIKKIPQMLLSRCEFDKTDYNLNIVHGKSYANFIDDCTGCPYQILYHTTEDESLQGEILCSGRYKIATLQDLARVTSRTKQFGDVEVSISRDRKGEFEPQLPKKNQTSVSQDIEKKFCPCTQKK